MKNRSCKNCQSLDRSRREESSGRLGGRYRYGCTKQRSGYICGYVADDEKLMVLSCSSWCGNHIETDTIKKISEEYGQKLQMMFDRWKAWSRKGCPEAEYPDGIYLNHLRSGMEFMMHQVEEHLDEEHYPESYYSQLPERVQEDYMVNIQEIKEAAAVAYQQYTGNANYHWLSEQIFMLDNDDKENSEAYRLLSHADILKQAIDDNDYFRMKQESRQEQLLEDMALCRKRIQQKNGKQRKGKKTKQKEKQIVGQLDIYEMKAS